MSIEKLQPRLERHDPAALALLDVNARYMRKEQYDQLVENIRRDGCLTSVPLAWRDTDRDRLVVLSGNHRIMAARDAGLTEVDVMVIDQPLTRQQRIAIQLSHNAIAGEDDPATLKQLYEELDDVDWRDYSGLDDATLDLLADIDGMEGLSEANLDFSTVQIVFLPHELERAEKALEAARTGADRTWLAARADYETTLDALSSTHSAHNVGNVATAWGLILDVFERHLTDLQAGYLTPEGEARHKNPVGWETIFGSRTLPAEAAATLAKALRTAEKRGDAEPGKGGVWLASLAEAYLSGGAGGS